MKRNRPSSGPAIRALLALLLIFVLAATHAAASTPSPVTLRASASPTSAHPGEAVTVTTAVQIAGGWHVYSSTPAPTGPSATDIAASPGWQPLGPTTEDAPIRQWDANFGTTVAYHKGTATFRRVFKASPGAAAPRFSISYQACSDRICLPPKTIPLAIQVSVSPGAVRPEYAGTGIRTALTSARVSSTADGGSNWLWFLFAAFAGGLLALLTPCVFPLIPITLTSFVKQAEGDRKRLMRLSTGYVVGIILLYTSLGLAVALVSGASGASRLAANPWVNLAESAVFLAFALSLFEIVTPRLPDNLGALQSRARAKGGIAGLAVLGVTFVVSSFTCVAPFVGTLLVAAAEGERLRPLLGMLAFAAAFASPFLIFALFPQWIAKIPRGGIWLARIKATLGFIELAAALKFLSNADLIWRWHILTAPVLLAAWALLFASAALYLLGALRFGIVAEAEAHEECRKISPLRRASAGAFGVAALYCFWGIAGRPLSPYVAAFLPPADYGVAAGASTMADRGLTWQSNYADALAEARAEGRLLLIDFTGYTCTNCRLNEGLVFPARIVQSELEKYTRVRLYTDGGDDGHRNQQLESTLFGDVALPLYGIVDSRTGSPLDKTAGVQSPNAFAAFLRRGMASWSAGKRQETPGSAVANGAGPKKIHAGRA